MTALTWSPSTNSAYTSTYVDVLDDEPRDLDRHSPCGVPVKRSQLGIILSLFAVFGSGIVVGAFGYHSYTTKTVSATAQPPAKKATPGGMAE